MRIKRVAPSCNKQGYSWINLEPIYGKSINRHNCLRLKWIILTNPLIILLCLLKYGKMWTIVLPFSLKINYKI